VDLEYILHIDYLDLYLFHGRHYNYRMTVTLPSLIATLTNAINPLCLYSAPSVASLHSPAVNMAFSGALVRLCLLELHRTGTDHLQCQTLTDLNDFITPSQACIKPVEQTNKPANQEKDIGAAAVGVPPGSVLPGR
jgi:hypothetical protein